MSLQLRQLRSRVGRAAIAQLPSPASAVLLLILGSTALRLAFGAALGLGVDESYMVASGRVLSLGYYDHPPAAWWLSWGAAHLFGSEAPIVVRLPFIALFALSTWLMYRLGAAIADARAGLWAAVLLNLSPVFGVTTGTWVLPDGPLDCALLGAALCLVRALERGDVGVVAGRRTLRGAGAAVEILGGPDDGRRGAVSAVEPRTSALAGDAEALARAAGRAADVRAGAGVERRRMAGPRSPSRQDAPPGMHLRPFAPLVTLAGEALFVLPWIWLPMMAVFVVALRRGPGEWRPWLLCCLAAPPIVAFAAGFRLVEPARAVPLGSARLPDAVSAAGRCGRAPAGSAGRAAPAGGHRGRSSCSAWRSSRRRCGSTGCIRSIAAVARKDPDIDAVDWTSLRDDCGAQSAAPGTIVGVPNWRDAGKIAYALGPDVTTLCLNRDARQFGIAWPPARFIGADVLILAPEHGERVAAELGPAFDGIERLPDASIRHAGRTLRTVAVFQARRLRVWPPPG